MSELVMDMDKQRKKRTVTSDTLDFLKRNVLSITELTRSNKLSEILNRYAGKETSEVYVIQNNKNKKATAVIADLEHYERLLKIQELVEKAIDDHIFQIALERKDDVANISLSEVVEEEDFDLDELLDSLDDFELDEE